LISRAAEAAVKETVALLGFCSVFCAKPVKTAPIVPKTVPKQARPKRGAKQTTQRFRVVALSVKGGGLMLAGPRPIRIVLFCVSACVNVYL
jgi:hypothetical protein